MKEPIKQLDTNHISSQVYVISPAQLEYISQVFSKNFADAMNMRAFAGPIYKIAEKSLRTALGAAKKMGEHH